MLTLPGFLYAHCLWCGPGEGGVGEKWVDGFINMACSGSPSSAHPDCASSLGLEEVCVSVCAEVAVRAGEAGSDTLKDWHLPGGCWEM